MHLTIYLRLLVYHALFETIHTNLDSAYPLRVSRLLQIRVILLNSTLRDSSEDVGLTLKLPPYFISLRLGYSAPEHTSD